MKRLTQIFMLMLLGMVLVAPATMAATDEAPSFEALTTSVVDALATAPAEAAVRPDPVFLAGSGAGGAGAETVGLVKGESASLPPNSIAFEDYLCCQVGNSCDCVYWPGSYCQPIGCPRDKTPPNC